MAHECRIPKPGDVVFFVARRGDAVDVLRALVLEHDDPHSQRVRDRLAAAVDREPLHEIRNDVVPCFEVYALLQSEPGVVVVTERLLGSYGGSAGLLDPRMTVRRGPFYTRSRAHEAAADVCRMEVREASAALDSNFTTEAKAALDHWHAARMRHEELATLQRSIEATSEGG